MGGTFDEVPFADLELSTPLAAGTVLVMRPAHARCWVLRDRMPLRRRPTSGPFWLSEGQAGRYRPYFENYTVDASIFEMISSSDEPACRGIR